MIDYGMVSVETGGRFTGHSRWLDSVSQRKLIKWLPERLDFENLNRPAIWYLPLNSHHAALCYSRFLASRTIGTDDQIVTKVLPVPKILTDRYHRNPAMVAYYALSEGWFTMAETRPQRGLLGEGCFFEPERWAAEFQSNELEEIQQAMTIHERVLVVSNGCQPLKLLAAVIEQIEQQRRWRLKFSWGLMPSSKRPFRLGVCDCVEAVGNSLLVNQSIRTIRMEERAQTANLL